MREEVAHCIYEHAPKGTLLILDHETVEYSLSFMTQVGWDDTRGKVSFALGEELMDPDHEGDPVEMLKEILDLKQEMVLDRVILS